MNSIPTKEDLKILNCMPYKYDKRMSPFVFFIPNILYTDNIPDYSMDETKLNPLIGFLAHGLPNISIFLRILYKKVDTMLFFNGKSENIRKVIGCCNYEKETATGEIVVYSPAFFLHYDIFLLVLFHELMHVFHILYIDGTSKDTNEQIAEIGSLICLCYFRGVPAFVAMCQNVVNWRITKEKAIDEYYEVALSVFNTIKNTGIFEYMPLLEDLE